MLRRFMDAYPQPGTVLNGRYRIDGLLGEGGMGAVFRALDLTQNLAVAIKFMSPEIASRPGMAQRFANEAETAARVSNEHVVRILGVGTFQQGLANSPLLVMELLEGRDLDHVVEHEAPLDPARAVHFGLQILRALQGVHGAGLVHRDLKPSNCYLVHVEDEHEFVKLIDFGITKLIGEDKGLTRTSTTLGTPAYMSPEQAKNAKNADARCDIYSVGVILYELLTRRRPFEGSSDVDLVVKICTEPPVPLLSRRADVPTGLVSAIERALVKSPEHRYASVEEFASALKPFANMRSQPLLARMGLGGLGMTPAPVQAPVGNLQRIPSGTAVGVPTPVGMSGSLPSGQRTIVDTPFSPVGSQSVGTQTVMSDGSGGLAYAPTPASSHDPIGLGSHGSAGPAPVIPVPVIPVNYGSGVDDDRGGGSRTTLLVVLALLAVGLIGFGVYMLTKPAPTNRTPASTSSEPDEVDSSGRRKPKRPKTEDPVIAEEPPIEPSTPSSATVAKPKPSATFVRPKPSTSTTGRPSGSISVRPLPSTTGISTLPTTRPTVTPTAIPLPSPSPVTTLPGAVPLPTPGTSLTGMRPVSPGGPLIPRPPRPMTSTLPR